MDPLHKIANWIDHNRYKALAGLLTAAVLIFGIGCQPKTASIHDPGVSLNAAAFATEAALSAAAADGERIRLTAEVEAFNAAAAATEARIAAGFDDLAHQEQIKAEIFTLAAGLITDAAAGTVTPAGLIGTGLTALAFLGGFGAYADGRRKDTVIDTQKCEINSHHRLGIDTTRST